MPKITDIDMSCRIEDGRCKTHDYPVVFDRLHCPMSTAPETLWLVHYVLSIPGDTVEMQVGVLAREITEVVEICKAHDIPMGRVVGIEATAATRVIPIDVEFDPPNTGKETIDDKTYLILRAERGELAAIRKALGGDERTILGYLFVDQAWIDCRPPGSYIIVEDDAEIEHVKSTWSGVGVIGTEFGPDATRPICVVANYN
jgi:hypothetical protein